MNESKKFNDGVALAAIQGLNQKVEQQNCALRTDLDVKTARIQTLEKEITTLKELVAKISTTRN